MKKIVFVCLGNICRSPMAEFVMKKMTDELHIESRATSSWEEGNPIHRGTQAIFRKHAIAYNQHKTSMRMTREDFLTFDLIIGMDAQNVLDLKAMAPEGTESKIVQFAEKVFQTLGIQGILTKPTLSSGRDAEFGSSASTNGFSYVTFL